MCIRDRNSALHKDSEFMHEYLNLGHMSLLDAYDLSVDKSYTFYLPHHSVFKGSSITTKLRVVFDGSAKTMNNLSLNDTLMVGPTVQQLSLIHIYRPSQETCRTFCNGITIYRTYYEAA